MMIMNEDGMSWSKLVWRNGLIKFCGLHSHWWKLAYVGFVGR